MIQINIYNIKKEEGQEKNCFRLRVSKLTNINKHYFYPNITINDMDNDTATCYERSNKSKD